MGLNLRKRYRKTELPNSILLPTYERLIGPWGEEHDWTDIDITPYVGQAKVAAILLFVELDLEASAGKCAIAQALFRPKGSTEEEIMPRLKVISPQGIKEAHAEAMLELGCNSNVFQAKFVDLSEEEDLWDPASLIVDFVGYRITGE